MQPLLEAAMAVLQSVEDRKMNIVLLNKALFYADLVALRDLGHVITGTKYIAIDNGPVVAKYNEKLVGALGKIGLATQYDEGMAKPVEALKSFDEYQSLTEAELAKIPRVARKFAAMTSRQASDFAHRNPGWKLAYNGPGTAGGVIDMRIAMQQLMDSDPWMDAPFSDDERAALSADEPLVDW